MPEGDTIWRTAAALRARIDGATVREAEPHPLARLRGRRVTAVEPNGKHLLIRFEGGVSLHSHMRMNGAWHLYAPGERWRRPAHLARAVLRFDDAVAVCFQAPVVELVRDPERPTRHLGPDVLAEPLDTAEILRRARAAGARTVGELLLDQRVCAGIGNIWRCETLWRRRLDPWRSPGDLPDETLAAVYATAQELMRANLAPAPFRSRRAVHGRAGRPCPRCGGVIRVRPQGEPARLTYHCPACQIDSR
jgi:endonuclease-8